MLLSGEVDGRGVVSRGAPSSEAEFDICSRGSNLSSEAELCSRGPSPSSEAEIHSRGRGPRAKRIGDARASALDGEARATVGP
jgi:hypothetical protein